MAEEKTGEDLVHLDSQTPESKDPPCGEKRILGMILTGDPDQVTCPKCRKEGK